MAALVDNTSSDFEVGTTKFFPIGFNAGDLTPQMIQTAADAIFTDDVAIHWKHFMISVAWNTKH